MSNYRRVRVLGGAYFFTVVTYTRRPILCDPSVLAALRASFGCLRATLPFQLDALAILPDHLHCIWQLPPGDADYSRRWAILKRAVAAACLRPGAGPPGLSDSQRRRRESGFWQRRYWEHLVRDEPELQRLRDYIHWNPIKHGYVTRAVDWPHSSFHRFVRAGVYSRDWDGGGVTGTEFGE